MLDVSMDDFKIPFRMVRDNWFLQSSAYFTFLTYSPIHCVDIETKRYRLTTAKKWKDLKEIFKLRNSIFHDDSSVIDIDKFDEECDHLAIVDKETSQICGTYRINCSKYSTRFYSEGEFDLNLFRNEKDVIIELGRACIHPAHRNGVVIDLLWKGIAKYAQMTNARYVFGCSSVYSTDYQQVLSLYNYLVKEDKVSSKFLVNTQQEYSFANVYNDLCDFKDSTLCDENEAKKLLPSLLRSYFLAGAQVHGTPAIDLEFSCSDFLTILDLEEVSPSFRRRYFKYLN